MAQTHEQSALYHPALFGLVSGSVIVNFLHLSLIAYPVFHPESMLSASIILLLVSLILFFDLFEMEIDAPSSTIPRSLRGANNAPFRHGISQRSFSLIFYTGANEEPEGIKTANKMA